MGKQKNKQKKKNRKIEIDNVKKQLMDSLGLNKMSERYKDNATKK